MGRYISPIVTSILMGSVLWVVDSIIFALSMTSVSISGALFTEVSALRLSLRLLIFLVCLLVGVYTGYKASAKNVSPLVGFEPDELFTDVDYLQASQDKSFSGDDTLRGLSYVENINKNPDIDVENRPIYYSDHIKRSLSHKVKEGHVTQEVNHVDQKRSDNLMTERFQTIQTTEAMLLWQYCGRLGGALKLNVDELSAIRNLCYCYDVGRFVNGSSFENHAEYGAEIIATVPELAPAAPLVYAHHEKWDGSGPYHMSGLDIPLGSRIFAVAWVYNAFTKPYGAWRLSSEDALDMLQMYAGTALDPELVAVFVGLVGQRRMISEGVLESA